MAVIAVAVNNIVNKFSPFVVVVVVVVNNFSPFIIAAVVNSTFKIYSLFPVLAAVATINNTINNTFKVSILKVSTLKVSTFKVSTPNNTINSTINNTPNNIINNTSKVIGSFYRPQPAISKSLSYSVINIYPY